MKTLLAVIFGLGILASPALALDEDASGMKLDVDAPYLLHLSGDHYIGAEIQKDLTDTDANEGWVTLVKYTYKGSLFSFSE